MGDDKIVAARPIDLAKVWGKALGQLADLWKSGVSAMMEAGSAEGDVTGGQVTTVTVAVAKGETPPTLVVRNMKGESFGASLPARAVTLTPRAPDHGMVVFDCTVDEALAARVPGDIYRGQVVDARGRVVGRIALDAGS
jgi:hypothetical protein